MKQETLDTHNEAFPVSRYMTRINTLVDVESALVAQTDFNHSDRFAVMITVDPVTKIKHFQLYTDDGAGNGNLVLMFPME